MRRFVSGAALAALLAGSASAHGIWLTNRPAGYVLALGHSDKEDAYGLSVIERAEGRDLAGRPLAVTAALRDGAAVFDKVPDLAVMAVSYRGGYSGQDETEVWIDGSRPGNVRALQVGRYDKYNLAILKPGANLAALPATRLQIVPLSDPLATRQGDTLAVRVLWDGRPVEGAELAEDYANNAHIRAARTDAAGEAQVVVRNQGLNVIGVVRFQRPSGGDPGADFVEHIATLSFGLRPFSHQPGYMHPQMKVRGP